MAFGSAYQIGLALIGISRICHTHSTMFNYTTTPQPQPSVSLHLKLVEVLLSRHNRAKLVRWVTVRLNPTYLRQLSPLSLHTYGTRLRIHIHPMYRWLVAMCMNSGVGVCWDPDYDAVLRSKQSTILSYGNECRARSRLGPPPIMII